MTLKLLSLQNIAIAENLTVAFGPGLNIITGQTGAGKSLLVDALGFLRGGKIDVAMIRDGANEAQVTGVFCAEERSVVRKYLEDYSLPLNSDDSNEIVLRRVVSRNGKSRTFINDTLVSSKVLQDISGEILDISSQFENQRLLDPSSHTQYLDIYSGSHELVSRYIAIYRKTNERMKRLAELELDLTRRRREVALCQFELNEIRKANPNEEEFREISTVMSLAKKGSSLLQSCAEIREIISESDVSALKSVSTVKRLSERILRAIDSADFGFKLAQDESPSTDLLDEILFRIDDFSRIMDKFEQRFSVDEEILAKAAARIDEYHRLLSRFGPTFTDLKEHELKCEEILNSQSSIDFSIEETKREINEGMCTCLKLAEELSQARERGSQELSTLVERELFDLGMQRTKFVCRLTRFTRAENQGVNDFSHKVDQSLWARFRELGSNGFESVTFLMSANAGMDVMPVARIASGGELSRVMLAIKTVLYSGDSTSVFVFDEIDTGISGNIASKVGKKLAKFCRNRQAICVTHLPQVASHAQNHYVAEKFTVKGKTKAKIRLVDAEERLREIAAMLSGENLTAESLAQAKKLVEEATHICSHFLSIDNSPSKPSNSR